jgi:hypothetical protein
MTAIEDGNDSGLWKWFLPALLGATLASKLLLAWLFPAFLTGDDLEIVETAAKYAVGLDYQPWGLRSLFHPLLLAFPVVKAGAMLGLSSPRWITFFASVPTALFSTLGVFLVHALARRWGWPEATARTAAFLYAAHYLNLGFGSTPFPRPISTCLLLAAFVLLSAARGGPAFALGAGLLAAAAFAVRWSEAVVLLPLAGFLLWKRRRAGDLLALGAGFAAGVLLFVGLFDALTWGRPFASLLEFWRIMHSEGLAASKAEPWYWYGKRVLHWAGPLVLLLLFPSARDRRVRAPLAIAAAILALMSLSPLKSIRFTQASIPFLCLAAALGWEMVHAFTGWRRTLAATALAVAVPFGLERTLNLLNDKSESAIEAAEFLHALNPPVRVVVLEQMWAYGEKLTLGNAVAIGDLAPKRPLAPESVAAVLGGADAAAFYDLDVGPEVSRLLTERDFAPCAYFKRRASLAVTVYMPAGRPCPPAPAL